MSFWRWIVNYWNTLFHRQIKPFKPTYPVNPVVLPISSPDLIPDAFSFTAVSNAALSTVYTSNTITVSGVTPGFSVGGSLSGTGFTYSQNGAAYQAPGAFTFQNGDTFTLRGTSSGANSTGETAVLSLGITLSNWTVTTLAASATLSSPTASATSSSTASLGVTTNTGSGTLDWVLSASSTVPTAAQIIAGQDSTGSAAPKAGSQAVSASGAQAISATGLTPTTTYFAFFLQVSGGNSNIVATASFATPALTTPTVTNVSATGAAPLVLSLTDGDYVAGKYLQWEFAASLTPAKNGDGSYTTTTQSGVTFIDGNSWSRLDLALGYNTPSGAFAFNCRVLQDDPSGAVTVTDQLGNTFNADASGWSTDYTDTIIVSSAVLTAATGTSCSKLLTVTTPADLVWTVNSGGAEILSRATIAAANTDFYVEMTVGTIAAGGRNIIGVTDNLIDFNGAGSGFFGGGSALPGDSGFNGFSLFVDGGIFVGWDANGTGGAFSIPGGVSAATTDVIGLRYNSSTKLVTCYYRPHATGTMVSVGTLTLTSLIPATPFVFSGGKSTGDSATVNFGGQTYALGGVPSGSNIYG